MFFCLLVSWFVCFGEDKKERPQKWKNMRKSKKNRGETEQSKAKESKRAGEKQKELKKSSAHTDTRTIKKEAEKKEEKNRAYL